MNKQQILKLLLEKIQPYDNTFIFHELFFKELMTILSKNAQGHESRFFKLFVKQLEFVVSLGTNVNQADHNEILKHVPGGNWYSLHISDSIINARLLMRFSKAGQPVFLLCFNEKQGKSVSEYGAYTETMVARYKELISEGVIS